MLDRERRPYDEPKGLVTDYNRQLYGIRSLFFFSPASHPVSHQEIAARLAAKAHASSNDLLGRQQRMEMKAWKLSSGVKDRAKRVSQKRQAAIKANKAFQG